MTESLSASDFQSAVEKLPERVAEAASFAEFFRLAERLPLAEFPDALAQLSSSKSKWQVRLLELWAIRNPGAAKAWFEAQPQAERVRLFPEWADTWVRMDPKGLRQWLASRADEERRKLSEAHHRDWVDSLAEADPEGALQLAKLYPKLISAPSVLQTWAARAPEAAAAAALELPASQRTTAANFIMRQWGSKDPETALVWIEQLSDPALADSARRGFVLAASRKDPVAALELIRNRFPADRQEEQWRLVAAFGSTKDPEPIAALAQKQSDPKLRSTMVAEAIRFMTAEEAGVQGGLWPPANTEAKTDARRAADLWLTESTSSREALPHLDHVAAALANQYGIDAALAFLDRIPPQLNVDTKDIPDWVAHVRGWNEVANAALNLPSGERRTTWLEKAVNGLAKQGELTATQALLDRLPPGSERNGVLHAFASATFSEDPQGSATLLLKLPNGSAHLTDEVARWLKQDRFEARRWITRTDLLTQEQKQHLLGSAAAPNHGRQ